MTLSKPPYLLRLLYRQFIWRFSHSEKAVYLTFDDGPHPEITPWVLEQLKQYNAKATFFLVGQNAQDNPEIVEQMIREGHSIGNHTFNHLNGWKAETITYLRNVAKCEALVKSNLFRPPYGKIKKRQAKAIRKSYNIVMWDVLSRDYDNRINAEKCLETVTKNSRNGSIIVFHDSKKAEKNLKAVLPGALEFLVKKGYDLKAIPLNHRLK